MESSLVCNHNITESRPLKSVAWEKWGTHDALRAQWPRNEVIWPIFKQYNLIKIMPLITSILLRWKALRFGCLHKKQYFRTLCTQGITWLTVGLTGLREVTHALFLFSSLFAFSRATFFNGRDSVMVITKQNDCPMEVWFVYHEYGYRSNWMT